MNELEKLLADLLMESATALLQKVRSGEATPADFKNIRELLKDNSITTDCSESDDPVGLLNEELPFTQPIALVRK